MMDWWIGGLVDWYLLVEPRAQKRGVFEIQQVDFTVYSE